MRKKTLLKILMIPILIIVLIQNVIPFALITFSNVTDSLEDNVIRVTSNAVENRQLSLENDMVGKCEAAYKDCATLNALLQEVLEENQIRAKDLIGAGEMQQKYLERIFPELVEVLQYNTASGIFVVLANAGSVEEANTYKNLSQDIKQAIQAEYISANGRLTIDTQTAYALALAFELLPENQLERVARDLVTRLGKDDDHLKTGFVGTPYINQMLSQYGYHKLATTIFLHEDYPSWLYAVNLGATTVWERWNSVLPDGSMNPEGMNSLNHYSIGAVMEWAYKFVLGIRNPNQGFKEFDLAPEFDYRLNSVTGHYQSSYGKIAVSYRIETDEKHTITLTVDVPFGSTAHVTLPRSEGVLVAINDSSRYGGQFDLTAGHYEISYIPTQDYVERYAASTPVSTIMADEELVAQIDAIHPVLDFFRKDPGAVQGGLGKLSLAKLDEILPFITIPKEDLKKIESLLEQTIILNQRNK